MTNLLYVICGKRIINNNGNKSKNQPKSLTNPGGDLDVIVRPLVITSKNLFPVNAPISSLNHMQINGKRR